MDENKNIEYLETCITGFKKYLPKRIVEKILTNPYNVRVESERRFVTILFGDVSGFTALSERLDPEDVIKVINKYFSKMCRIVDKYGGDIDKFVGDAVIVVFGAPVAHEDDPERAIRAALEMQKAMATIEPVYAKGEYVKVTMHIGINTGEVVALNMGVDDRMEYTVMGDNVNLTARLEAVATSGEIIIPDRTYKYVKDIFDVDVLDPVMVKGKKEPIQIYRVKGVKDTIKTEDSYSFIGRDDVLLKPIQLIDKFLEHEPFSLAYTGESGYGKTKFSQYIADKADRKNINLYDIAGKSFYAASPLMPIKEFVSGLLKFSDDAPADVIKEKINNTLIEGERNGLYLLFDLNQEQVEEQEFVRQVSSSLEALLLNRCAKGFHLIFLSDLHFYDRLSEIIIKRVYDRLRQNKNISFALSSRERIDFKSIDLIYLEKFDESMTAKLITDRLHGKDADSMMIKEVHEKSKGNPYYAVELLKFLIDGKFLEERDGKFFIAKSDKAIVPDSLKSVFLEQMDKLSEKEKLFLQYSSVLGEEFRKSDSADLLKFSAKDVDDNIKSLSLKGYISFIDNERYAFSSELFYESVYNSLTKGKRGALHDAIALYMENKSAVLSEGSVRAIARHFELSGNIHKAPVYLEKAALFDRKYFSYRQAVEKYEKAIKFYSDKKDFVSLANTVFRIAAIYLAVGNMKNGLEILDVHSSTLTGSKENECQYFFFRGILFDRSGDIKNAEEEYNKALNIAVETGNKSMIAKIYNSFGIMNSNAGKFAEALNYFNKALDISIKQNNMQDISSQYINIGKIYGMMNDFNNALKYYGLAYDLQTSEDDKKGLVLTLVNMGTIYDNMGNTVKAEEIYKKGLEKSIETSNDSEKARILNNLANIKFMTGRFEEALNEYNESAQVYESLDDKKGLAEVYANMAEIEVMFGEFIKAEPLFEKVLKLCDETGHNHLKLYANINYANNLSFLGYLEKAENILNNVIETSKKRNIPDFIALAENVLAKVCGLSSDLLREKEILQDSLKLAQEIKNPDIEFSVKSTFVKTLIEMNLLEEAQKTADEVYQYAKSSGNEMLLSDVMASLADIYQKNNDQERLAEIAAMSFELSEKTKSKLSLIRNIIVLARFYLFMSDESSCEEILKNGEETARLMGSLEHIIIINRIADALYEKTGNVQMRYNSLMKCVNAIEEYTSRAGEKNYIKLIEKRGFMNFYSHYINVMTELHDFAFIKEQLKNYDRKTVEKTLNNMLEKNLISKQAYTEII
jgi:class 3 adenylate cyclase/tetratricopeptide (TPR) repeat protein